jgi:hypothetical protein
MKKNKAAILIMVALTVLFSCERKKCQAPVLTSTMPGQSIIVYPGDSIASTITVAGDKVNIKTFEVTKTFNGSTQGVFQSQVNSKDYEYNFLDSIPDTMTIGSVIVYKFTATADCKTEPASEITLTVYIGPSSEKIEDSVSNSQAPKTYSRFDTILTESGAWNIEYSMFHSLTGFRYSQDADAEKDIVDSTLIADPYGTNARWGSRNGSLFKKIPGFDFTNASPKSIIDAWNSGGIANSIISINKNDMIIINIRNKNRFAVINIRDIIDDGPAHASDYVLWQYKTAQKWVW